MGTRRLVLENSVRRKLIWVGALVMGAAAASVTSITGTSAADTLVGDAGSNVICGFGGNDTVRPGGGDDTVHAGAVAVHVEHIHEHAH
jgi:Ca2+-binding RTX toxin-like protein